jgi:heptosyltransferase-2
MTTPALQRLREKFPHSRITLLTHEKLAPLWEHHPAIDGVVSFSSGENPWSMARRLRAENFDAALVLPNSPRSALEVWLARIPRRIGYARPWRDWLLTQAVPNRPGHVPMRKRSIGEINRLIRLPPSDPALAARITSDASAHQIHEYLHLVGALGANSEPLPPRLRVMPAEIASAVAKFGLQPQGNAGDASPCFGLNPGAEYGPAKRWPSERFIAAACELQRRTQCRWLIFGGQSDKQLATEIATGIKAGLTGSAALQPPLSLAGETTLRELCALLSHCRVLLTNDTGPMHVAAALGTPVIGLFGSTSPELTGPGLPGDPSHTLLNAKAPCSPCFQRSCPIDLRCLTGISVESVIQALQRIELS